MASISEYVKENLSLSFASWSQGQKVSSLIGVLVAAVIVALGWIGLTIAQPDVQKYWPVALVTFFLVLVLVVTPFRMWQRERRRAEGAELKLNPKLKVTFDKSQGCQHKTKLKARAMIPGQGVQVVASSRVRYFRVRIETQGIGVIKDCSGYLLSLKRDGRTLFDHDSIALPIAPAERENSTIKDVRAGIPEYLDVFLVMDTNKVKITSPGFVLPISIDPNTLFSGPGEYRFHVVVSAPDSAPAPIDVVLKWTGDWESAEAYAG